MNHKLANGMKMWKGNGNTITLLFSLKGLGNVTSRNKMTSEHHGNGTLQRRPLRKSEPANKQHTNHLSLVIWLNSVLFILVSEHLCRFPRNGKFRVLRMGNYPWSWMSHKLTNGMKVWKGNGNTTTLLFYFKWLEILHQGRRKVKNMVMENFNRIIFQESWSANK